MSTLLLYLGRRGPIGRLAKQLLDAANEEGAEVSVALSRQNEDFGLFAGYDDKVVAFDTFSTGIGSVARIDNLLLARARLAEEIRRRRVGRVISLMPHIWSPLLSDVIASAGARYALIVHDAQRHPGDITGWANRWILSDLHRAEEIFTLSSWVANELRAAMAQTFTPITPLFHPDLETNIPPRGARVPGPSRVAFIGRIMPYKGLHLLVEALEMLRARGTDVELEINGEGDLGGLAARLTQLGARVLNRWASESELAATVARCDVVVACHTEASQSGVVAFAFGHGAPVIATPVGGLMEQIDHGNNGLIAKSVTAEALAEQIEALVRDSNLLETLTHGVRDGAHARSASVFLKALLQRSM